MLCWSGPPCTHPPARAHCCLQYVVQKVRELGVISDADEQSSGLDSDAWKTAVFSLMVRLALCLSTPLLWDCQIAVKQEWTVSQVLMPEVLSSSPLSVTFLFLWWWSCRPLGTKPTSGPVAPNSSSQHNRPRTFPSCSSRLRGSTPDSKRL